MTSAKGHQRAQSPPASSPDADLVRRAIARDGDAFRTIIRTYNQRLYRMARSILKNDTEAEDAVQEAYIRAFTHLESFRGEAGLGTWLTRIVINEALGRLRAQRPTLNLDAFTEPHAAKIIPFPLATKPDDPERTMAQRQLLRLVEQATDNLPDAYRIVFTARVIEGMSVEDTAGVLGLRPETVKTRLHRARRLVREQLDRQIGPVLMDAFPFAGQRCERMAVSVMRRLGFAQ